MEFLNNYRLYGGVLITKFIEMETRSLACVIKSCCLTAKMYVHYPFMDAMKIVVNQWQEELTLYLSAVLIFLFCYIKSIRLHKNIGVVYLFDLDQDW